MKNKEKYIKEIVELACDGNRIAIVRQTREFRSCYETPCRECLFHSSNTEQCKAKAREWAESEYVERPVISKMDRAFLEYLGEEYKYIARDKNKLLFAWKNEPVKTFSEGEWTNITNTFFRLNGLNIEFPMVKWSDSEP